MDALYVYKQSDNGDFEIRYSLRSLERHAPFVGKVWIYGDSPNFLATDRSLVECVPQESTSRVLDIGAPVTNFFLLMFLSSLIPALSFEYLFLSDDFVLLKDLTLEEACKDRYSEDMAQITTRGSGPWVDALWRTYHVLTSLGYTGYNFETHVPARMTRKRVLDAYCDLKDYISEDSLSGLMGLTAVLNHAHTREKMPLTNLIEENSRCGFWGAPPSWEDVVQRSQGKTFFNFDDRAFGAGIRRFLVERFPARSRYESDQ
jgi:hypothetical protein